MRTAGNKVGNVIIINISFLNSGDGVIKSLRNLMRKIFKI